MQIQPFEEKNIQKNVSKRNFFKRLLIGTEIASKKNEGIKSPQKVIIKAIIHKRFIQENRQYE